jgi:hypothetical protein
MRCVAPCRREGIIVEYDAPALFTGAGLGISGCPGMLGTRPAVI